MLLHLPHWLLLTLMQLLQRLLLTQLLLLLPAGH
jgi:hypothetical protein